MFKKLKSIFVIEDEDRSNQSSSSSSDGTPKSAQKDDAISKSSLKIERPVFDANNPPKKKLNEKFINRLLGAIEEQNIGGFDYLEYKQALQNLNKVKMDEPTKYKSALAVAKTMGANKEVLLSSANHYLKVLESEEHKFIEAFKNQINQQVTLRSDEIKAQEQSIEQMKSQIIKLQADIEDRRKRLESSKNKVDSAKEKVELTRNDFYQAYYVVSEQIKEDLVKIQEYLS